VNSIIWVHPIFSRYFSSWHGVGIAGRIDSFNFFLENLGVFDILNLRRNAVEDENPSPVQPSAQNTEILPQVTEASFPPQAVIPQQEPIVLSKLFPDAKHDLDTLFPDTQMKELLREIHRTRQGNQRFLKRLNLSKIEPEEDDSGNEEGPSAIIPAKNR
jgi:hypothetical protein